jgi:phospholipase/carboxylesterase
LAGFSQGGGVALYAGLRYSERLGGILALSTYLPGVEELITSASVVNQSVPIMMAHGTMDSLIPLQMAKKTFLRLKEGGYEIEFHTYPMGHGMCEEEIHDISKWIQNIFDSTFIRDLAPTA